MTNQEILQRAMLKASSNGWDSKVKGFNQPASWVDYNMWLCQQDLPIPIIFTHDFARAFFGEGIIEAWDSANPNDYGVIAWLFHLQQLVLEKEPLKYLERFLK